MSIERHSRTRQVELGKSLGGRRKIYLDACFWIIVRDTALGIRTEPAARKLLHFLRRGVTNGRLVCPISASMFLELMKQPYTLGRRISTAQLIDELSLGITMIPSRIVMGTEIHSFLLRAKGGTDLYPNLRDDIWPGRSILAATDSARGDCSMHPMDERPKPDRPKPERFHGGSAQTWNKRYAVDNSHQRFRDDHIRLALRADGKISLVAKTNNIDSPLPHISMRWVLAEMANVLRVIDRIRDVAGTGLRYSLAAELRYDDHSAVDVTPVTTGQWWLTLPEDETGRLGGLVESDPVALGPYDVGGSGEWSDFLRNRLEELLGVARQNGEIGDISFAV